jgi:cytochrome c peroxidase
LKKAGVFLVIICSMLALLALRRPGGRGDWAEGGQGADRGQGAKRSAPALAHIRSGFADFAKTTGMMRMAMSRLAVDDPFSVGRARQALILCRLSYKKIEYFMEYFFYSSASIYNHPAKLEVEEPFMEYEEPRGFQVIEQLLFENNAAAQKERLMIQANAVDESAKDLDALLYDFQIDDGLLLESLRIELIRIIALNIEGYDAPKLKSGIPESRAAMLSIRDALEPYLAARNGEQAGNRKTVSKREADIVALYIARSLRRLGAKTDFDHFDRLGFLTDAALPLQLHLGRLIADLGMEQHTVPALNYRSANLFAVDALNKEAFPHVASSGGKTAGTGSAGLNQGTESSQALVQFGRRMFFETALSGNGLRSCASCHRPANYFTDRRSKSVAIDNHSLLRRNAPSLYYAGMQYSQFWDGRAKTLEEQVISVLTNPVEMNASIPVVERRLQKKERRPVPISEVAAGIAAYIRSLSPMNSSFDRYIAGNIKALSADQVRGFNLFMGKAQCGTCHFAPLFNGLTPPLYKNTEYEVLGVPGSDDLNRPRADTDSGRFLVFPLAVYQQAFKTPTVRNVAVTGPYMHNGAFHTLEKVMDFYNKGGGKGLGLDVPGQTLDPAPLWLSPREIADICQFLRALTDSPVK